MMRNTAEVLSIETKAAIRAASAVTLSCFFALFFHLENPFWAVLRHLLSL